jgi:tetratricopeptide (TPR) repeat protein
MSRKKIQSKMGGMDRHLATGLVEAAGLLDEGRVSDARRVLLRLLDKWPGNPDLLAEMCNISDTLQDAVGLELHAERLRAVRPQNPLATLGLVRAYIANGRLALGLMAYREFLARWPTHPRAEETRRSMARLEAVLGDYLRDLSPPEGRELEVVAQHERVQSLLAHGQFDQARAASLKLLAMHPRLAAAHNNLAHALWEVGDAEGAEAASLAALETDPGNLHARCNLARFCFLRGLVDQARSHARLALAAPRIPAAGWVKLCETFAFLGDDGVVMDLGERVKAAKPVLDPTAQALLNHWVAFSQLQRGHRGEARRLWKEAARLAPGFALATMNLQDLDAPAGEHDGPYQLALHTLVRRSVLEGLMASARPDTGKQAARVTAAAILEKAPELRHLAPTVLLRGDPSGRDLVLAVAEQTRDPQILEAVRVFALGPVGPDRARVKAAQLLSRMGVLDPGPTTLWVDGHPTQVLLMGYHVHDDAPPGTPVSPEVEDKLANADEALEAGQDEQVEAHLREALALEPGSRDVNMTLAQALAMQGRIQEARQTLEGVLTRNPDDVGARCTLGRLWLVDDEVARARDVLDPVLRTRHIHVDAFADLCQAQAALATVEGNHGLVEAWLRAWAEVQPEKAAQALAVASVQAARETPTRT